MRSGNSSSESFSVIIHDPPMFSLAGELYSAFYQQAYRVLKQTGRIFTMSATRKANLGRGSRLGSSAACRRRASNAWFVRRAPSVLWLRKG